MVTVGQVSAASCEETRASLRLTVAGREAGTDTSEGGSATWALTGGRGRGGSKGDEGQGGTARWQLTALSYVSVDCLGSARWFC